jgi:protein-S-isoprenylcysteine O-methyltransferase Ste14
MRAPEPASDDQVMPSERGQGADWGRLVALPLLAMAAYLSIASLFSFGWRHDHPVVSGLALASRLATIAFYCLIVFAYLRRRPPLATSASSTAFAAAMAATFLPFAFTFLGYHTTGIYPLLVVDVLLIAGTGFATWGVRHLNRSFSIVPQARAIVTTGPYRWVRHPLYAGELLAALGLTLLVGSLWGVVVWVALLALQLYRAHEEELLLSAHLPGYAAYAARTGQLIPGVGRRRR